MTLVWPALLAGALAGLGSVPHCASMCGPLAAFACGRAPARPRGGAGAAARYQLGRWVSYAGLGAAAGGAGGAVASALSLPWARAVVAWTLAAALLWMAWRLWALGGAPGRRLPRPTPLRTGRAAAAPGLFARLAARLPADPAVFGALTALLPCGALYGALALAAGTGSAAAGAVAMSAFALVSGVGVFGAGWVAARIRREGRPATLRILAAALAVGALVMALRPVPTLRGEPVLCHPAAEHR